jgi:hypothetical protein
MGRSVWAPECFNCSAPDTGNMEVGAAQRGWLPEGQLHPHGRCQWLFV